MKPGKESRSPGNTSDCTQWSQEKRAHLLGTHQTAATCAELASGAPTFPGLTLEQQQLQPLFYSSRSCAVTKGHSEHWDLAGSWSALGSGFQRGGWRRCWGLDRRFTEKVLLVGSLGTGSDGAKWLWSLLLITASIWLLMSSEQHFSGGSLSDM